VALLNKLVPSKSAVLPVGAVDYSRQYQDQLNNILRLYFNQVDNNLASILTNVGGRFLGFPYGSFLDTTDQVAGSTTVAYAMRFNATEYSNSITVSSKTATFTASINNGGVLAGTVLTVATIATGSVIYLGMQLTGVGVTVGTRVIAFVSGSGGVGTYTVSASQLVATVAMVGDLPSKLSPEFPGIYNLQASAELLNNGAGSQTVEIWLMRNGVNVANSNKIYSVNEPIDTSVVAVYSSFIELQGADYIEIMWRTSDINVYINHTAIGAAPIRPVTPSVKASMSFVSSIPA
jgi:hypothetical protein